RALVKELDEAAQASNDVVEVLQLKGISPTQASQAVDALLGRPITPSPQQQQNGMGNYGGGNFGGGFRPGGGVGGGVGGRGAGGCRGLLPRRRLRRGRRPVPARRRWWRILPRRRGRRPVPARRRWWRILPRRRGWGRRLPTWWRGRWLPGRWRRDS